MFKDLTLLFDTPALLHVLITGIVLHFDVLICLPAEHATETVVQRILEVTGEGVSRFSILRDVSRSTCWRLRSA